MIRAVVAEGGNVFKRIGRQQGAHELLMLLLDKCKGLSAEAAFKTRTTVTSSSSPPSVTEWPAVDVSLPLGPRSTDAATMSVQMLLEASLRPESLTDDVTRSVEVVSAPRTLLVHLRRWYADTRGQRRPTPIITNPALCMKTIDGEHTYDLVGIVHHAGSVRSGHYTTDVRLDGRWFHCNDSRISELPERGGQPSTTAYICVYKRRA